MPNLKINYRTNKVGLTKIYNNKLKRFKDLDMRSKVFDYVDDEFIEKSGKVFQDTKDGDFIVVSDCCEYFSHVRSLDDLALHIDINFQEVLDDAEAKTKAR